MEPEGFVAVFTRARQFRGPVSNPQAGRSPLVSSPRLLIRHIHSYPPYLEAVSSIHNWRMRDGMVTRDPHIMGFEPSSVKIAGLL
jgi:hypothetical protein